QAWSFSSYASPLSLKRQLKWQPKQHSQQHLPPGQSTDATCLWDPIQAPNPLKVTRNQVLPLGFVAPRRRAAPLRDLRQGVPFSACPGKVDAGFPKEGMRHQTIQSASRLLPNRDAL